MLVTIIASSVNENISCILVCNARPDLSHGAQSILKKNPPSGTDPESECKVALVDVNKIVFHKTTLKLQYTSLERRVG